MRLKPTISDLLKESQELSDKDQLMKTKESSKSDDPKKSYEPR